MSRTDYGNLFYSTGGLLVAASAVCIIAGVVGFGDVIATLFAAYVILKLVNALDRGDAR
jgi:hypothetical protein